MAAMAALGRRLRALGRAVGWRGVQTPPGDPEPPPSYALVERLLPPTRIPDPPPHANYPTPSGWSPPAGPPPALPYFVARSRYHALPVYARPHRTELRRIQGDIWALERDLRASLGVQEVEVNEVTGSLRLRGGWGGALRGWLLSQGF